MAPARPMCAHEKECALAAYAILIERAEAKGDRKTLKELRREYREIIEAPTLEKDQ